MILFIVLGGLMIVFISEIVDQQEYDQEVAKHLYERYEPLSSELRPHWTRQTARLCGTTAQTLRSVSRLSR
jgi:hypothetical protein